MPTLREIIEAKGYTTRMLVDRWPAKKPIPFESRKSWLNKWLKNPNQQHIDMVAGLPNLPNLSDRESKS